ncbi:FCD domain-containing protein [Paenibacillus sp. FSL R7-0297]|uniref:FadR/GntR family transcriptional regulator n=1 Tax=unclassified Paenibacillus TaxID=185978 RepID=UPI0030F507AC
MQLQFPLQFEKVNSKKVSDFILEQLEEAIILKELLSEEQLPTERELATIFNASRLAVREALGQLEANGLIEKRVGAKGGTFVLPVTMNSHRRTKKEIEREWDKMLKVFEFRMLIEPEAAFLAAGRITPEEVEQLQELLDMSRAEDCPRELFRALDVKFHLNIAKSSNNLYFEKAVRQIRTQINPALDLMPYNHEIRSVNCENHSLLLEAIQARDAGLSKEIMRQHIAKSAEAIYARVFDGGERG